MFWSNISDLSFVQLQSIYTFCIECVNNFFRVISPTGIPSLYQLMTGVGLPVTSHTKLVDWLNTNDTLLGISLSRKSGGTVEVFKGENWALSINLHIENVSIKNHKGEISHR